MMLFYGSGATEPQDVPNEYLTMIFKLGQSGIKKLISLSFKGEHINLIKVIATKDSDELTESREHVRIIFMNCQKSEHNSFGNAIYRNSFIYFLYGLFYMIWNIVFSIRPINLRPQEVISYLLVLPLESLMM